MAIPWHPTCLQTHFCNLTVLEIVERVLYFPKHNGLSLNVNGMDIALELQTVWVVGSHLGIHWREGGPSSDPDGIVGRVAFNKTHGFRGFPS